MSAQGIALGTKIQKTGGPKVQHYYYDEVGDGVLAVDGRPFRGRCPVMPSLAYRLMLGGRR